MHDSIVQIVFAVFATIAVVSAFLVITQNNPVRSVLFLVLTFFAVAPLWILLEAEFLALILVLVYVGAVMTLFLFIVMMLNIDTESRQKRFLCFLPLAVLLGGLMMGLLCKVLPNSFWQESATVHHVVLEKPRGDNLIPTKNLSNTTKIGIALYQDYILPLELAAALLLVAIVSAITLAHQERKRGKKQDIVTQIMTRREDRVVLLPMQPEKFE